MLISYCTQHKILAFPDGPKKDILKIKQKIKLKQKKIKQEKDIAEASSFIILSLCLDVHVVLNFFIHIKMNKTMSSSLMP